MNSATVTKLKLAKMTEVPKGEVAKEVPKSEVPKIVYDRLRTAAPEPGLVARAHPDADLLTAFAEQQTDSLWTKTLKDDSEQSRRMRTLLRLYANGN